MKTETLRYKKLWLLIGFSMVAFVVFETLTSSPMGIGIKLSDKVLHITGYFGMMGWFVQIVRSRNHQLLLVLAFISMGIMLEFLQGWGGIRHYEVADMLANASGVMLAWLLSLTRMSRGLICFENILQRIFKINA